MSKKTETSPKVKKSNYFSGVKREMKKVVWPTKKQLMSYTGVVIVSCIAISLLIWVFDSAFIAALQLALGIEL
jgi:preprotein translocase subunit SecE